MITGEITGFEDLAAQLEELAPRLARKYLRQAVLAGALVVRDAARANAPVGSVPHWIGRKARGRRAQPGNLRKNIMALLRPSGGELAVTYGVGVAAGGFYGKFKEFGTKKMAAHPWLRPAFDGNIQAVIEAMRQKLADALGQEYSR